MLIHGASVELFIILLIIQTCKSLKNYIELNDYLSINLLFSRLWILIKKNGNST